MYLLALTLGLSCGVGCGSVVTPFMTSYVIGKQKSQKDCFKSILVFSLGKILIMMALGAITALIGESAIEVVQIYIPFQLNYLFNVVMVLLGIYIVSKSLKKKSCSQCTKISVKIDVPDRGYNEKKEKDMVPLFMSGVIYGITPCAPLGIMLTTTIGIGIIKGALLLGFFGLITCLSPAIIQVFIAGLMIPMMKKEIPEKIHWISLFAGCLMICLGALPWIQAIASV